MNADTSLNLTAIFLPDNKGRGYTGYFAEFPDLIAQGSTREDVELNLISSLKDILAFNKAQENFISNIGARESHNVKFIYASH